MNKAPVGVLQLVRRITITLFTFCVFTPLLGELILRAGIALKIPYFRSQNWYASCDSPDDWKLLNRWHRKDTITWDERVHPTLGFSRKEVNSENPLGLLESTRTRLILDDRTKILFYGASFAAGIVNESNETISQYLDQQIATADVLDLAVPGYRIHQKFLMFKETYAKVRRPLIMIGIHPANLFGITLPVNRFQKVPYFTLDSDKRLILRGVPIERNQEEFFRKHPLKVKSYFTRFLLKGI